MKSILDPGFRYVPSFETDLRKTFERVRREWLESRVRQAIDLKVHRLAGEKRSASIPRNG